MAVPAKTYKDSGVDIEKGDRFTDFIKTVSSKALGKGIGGFAGGIPLQLEGFRNPVLLSTTDGVGTKLLVAKKLGNYATVGIDLVAMCVNDLIVAGAKPLVFLDYIACSRIDEKKLQSVITGIIRGCEIAGCTLAGGETAEMPDMYQADDIDLAGFAAGLVEKERMLPRTSEISAGDLVLGLPSSGIHSNGFSLARKVLAGEAAETWEEILIPTRIYVNELSTLLKTGKILAAAHITGGGLAGNLCRVIPGHLRLKLDYNWSVPDIFSRIQQKGRITDEEMQKVFNLGIGLAIIVKKGTEEEIISLAAGNNFEVFTIGRLEG